MYLHKIPCWIITKAGGSRRSCQGTDLESNFIAAYTDNN